LAAARTAYERRWPEDLLYAAIFLAERLHDGGHAEAAAATLRAVIAVPDGDSDAMIRRRAEQALAVLGPLPATPAPMDYDTLASTIATADNLAELARRISATH
jgi:hypothetical protein